MHTCVPMAIVGAPSMRLRGVGERAGEVESWRAAAGCR